MRDKADFQTRKALVQKRFNQLMSASHDKKLKDHLEEIRKQSENSAQIDALLPDSIRILLVDDLTYITQTVSHMLEKENYLVHVAKNGAEGIMLFINHIPDIVITDLRLPDFNGIILAKLIRKLDEQVPIIFITANEMDPEIGLEHDFDIRQFDMEESRMSLLLKPIQKEVILKTIKYYL